MLTRVPQFQVWREADWTSAEEEYVLEQVLNPNQNYNEILKEGQTTGHLSEDHTVVGFATASDHL